MVTFAKNGKKVLGCVHNYVSVPNFVTIYLQITLCLLRLQFCNNYASMV